METIAFYRESIIKTYGLFERTGLCLVTIELPSDRLGDWGTGLAELTSRLEASLVLVICRPASPTSLRLLLLLDESQTGPPAMDRPQGFPDDCCAQWRVDRAVELVYFQGPHYGDRYGIAGAALEALADRGVPVLAMACTRRLGLSDYPRGESPPGPRGPGTGLYDSRKRPG